MKSAENIISGMSAAMESEDDTPKHIVCDDGTVVIRHQGVYILHFMQSDNHYFIVLTKKAGGKTEMKKIGVRDEDLPAHAWADKEAIRYTGVDGKEEVFLKFEDVPAQEE